MPKYPIKQPLKYDGDEYAGGDSVDMPKKQAQTLIDAGIIGQAVKPSKPVKPEDLALLKAAIIAAIASMDASANDLWISPGVPKVEPLNGALGYTVSAADRDTAIE